MANFGDIITSTSLGAGQSIRRNAGDSAFEAFTPSGGDIPLTLIAPTTDETITDGYSAHVSDYYEIADTFMLEIGNGSVFEIG